MPADFSGPEKAGETLGQSLTGGDVPAQWEGFAFPDGQKVPCRWEQSGPAPEHIFSSDCELTPFPAGWRREGCREPSAATEELGTSDFTSPRLRFLLCKTRIVTSSLLGFAMKLLEHAHDRRLASAIHGPRATVAGAVLGEAAPGEVST